MQLKKLPVLKGRLIGRPTDGLAVQNHDGAGRMDEVGRIRVARPFSFAHEWIALRHVLDRPSFRDVWVTVVHFEYLRNYI
jgi:hypothetical protein